MAKKKRKKRPAQRPTQRAGQRAAPVEEVRPPGDRPASARAEKKEQARRDRERRIKLARRRQRMRRATRWGAVLGVAGAVTAVVLVQVNQGNELEEAAQAAAQRLNCDPVDLEATEQPDPYAGMSSEEIARVNHSEPFAQGENGVPATAGPHGNALEADPHVYTQPVPEANLVHNLEHGYVLIYYSAEGPNALPDEVVDALADLANEEDEVKMAPYTDLANGVAMVAWRQLQTCDPSEGADPEDAVTVAQAFIEEHRNGPLSPEPAA